MLSVMAGGLASVSSVLCMAGTVRRTLWVAGVTCVLVLCLVGSAWGFDAGPGWQISSQAAPSTFSVGDNVKCTMNTLGRQDPECDFYEVNVLNAGKLAAEGTVTLHDTVPAGLAIQRTRLYWSQSGNGENDLSPGDCAAVGQVVTCSLVGQESVLADATLKLQIFVQVEASAKFMGACPVGYPEATGCVLNEATIEGGGAPSVSTGEPVTRANLVNGAEAGFGFSSFAFDVNGPEGLPDSIAGDHPYELDSTVYLNTKFKSAGGGNIEALGAQDPRDVVVTLPVGLVGSVLATPRCAFSQLSSHILSGVGGCPADTIVGHIRTEPGYNGQINGPIYNMVPEEGQAAEFAFVDALAGTHVLYSHVVPSPHGYVLETISPQVPQGQLRSIEVQFYGVPDERDGSGNAPIPFFTNPTVCSGEEQVASIYMDSWQNPARFTPQGVPVSLEEPEWVHAESRAPAITGCNALQLSPELEALPTSHEADSPTGMNFGVKVPQPEAVGVPAAPSVRRIVTRLPEGLTVDPSSGNGLAACSEAQIGWLGGSAFDFNETAPSCPEGAKVGSLEVESPLVGGVLHGEVLIAAQNHNPFGTPFAVYAVINDPVTGVLVKAAGELKPNLNTGQVTAVFPENPDFPFSALRLHFFEGPRGSLATPQVCGSYTTGMELTPWSFPDSGPPASVFSSFSITGSCTKGFAPSFTAGSVSLQAGAFTSLETGLERSDTEDELADLSVTLPEGLLAKLAGVGECTEAEIAEVEAGTGGCPASSFLGTVTTGAGPGPDPLYVSGKAYLTGPYNGGSYGLAVVVPAVAGPYNFGNVVVRQSLRIDPRTGRVTDVSDPFPALVEGIPLRVRSVELTLERPEFALNPTSCNKLEFNGTFTASTPGAPTALSHNVAHATVTGATSSFTTPFEVGDCQKLKFEPSIKVETKGQASKAFGQSLRFKISYPKNPLGAQSWLDETKFDIPKQLPSRLETIQQACTAETFEKDRAACPKASIIGHAVVHTPALPVPLEGPLYFVSYANLKFPETVLVLKGDNVTIEQHGETFIDHKTGITSATFHSIPDAPVESIEVELPAGPFSEFGSNIPQKDRYNFCGQKLSLPTFFKAQNGLEIHQSTPITITGCKKTKPTHSSKKHHKTTRSAAKRHHH